MTLRVHKPLLFLLFLTTPLVACARAPEGAAPSPALAAPTVAQSPAPQLVTGLPDFTALVEQVGPGVVNIEARTGARQASRTQVPEQDEIPEIFRRMLPPGFQIPDHAPQQRRGISMGSGFIISADGYVLTNHHVIDGADEVVVRLPDRREFTAKVVGSDQQYDVALLKIEARDLPTVRLGNSAGLKPGQWVVAIGSPLGLDHSVTAGIISAVGRSASPEQRYVPFIQTDVAINRGNSGGPLLNTRGEVVGINSQIFSMSGGYMGISFAIPVDLAMGAVEQIKKTGRVSRGQLGVQVQPLTASDARGLKLSDTRGALVAEVLEDSPAAKAGLEPMDVITSFNGVAINQSSDLPPVVGALPPGTRAKVTVLRDGKPREFTVTLSELQEDPALAASSGPSTAPGAPPAAAGSNPLGIVSQEIDANTRRRLGLKADEKGVLVARINGAATREAGLQPGDVILQVGRQAVDSPAALNRQLAGARSGDTVMLLVRRGGATRFFAVTLQDE
ncbi:DegQ family serine endoprotease [Pseudoxanthomonas mexicana]|uniref:DegQ family serine endoprotease n=1 Tax=Pseudoxanthomonas mexicana TaxID=128785 RepID=UPI00398B80F5